MKYLDKNGNVYDSLFKAWWADLTTKKFKEPEVGIPTSEDKRKWDNADIKERLPELTQETLCSKHLQVLFDDVCEDVASNIDTHRLDTHNATVKRIWETHDPVAHPELVCGKVIDEIISISSDIVRIALEKRPDVIQKHPEVIPMLINKILK